MSKDVYRSMWDDTAEELLTLVENNECVDYDPDVLWQDYGEVVYTTPDEWATDGTGYIEQDDGLYYPETEVDNTWYEAWYDPADEIWAETDTTWDETGTTWDDPTDDTWYESTDDVLDDAWTEPVDDGMVTIVEDGGYTTYSEGALWQDYYGTVYTDGEAWLNGEGGFSEWSDGYHYPESDVWGSSATETDTVDSGWDTTDTDSGWDTTDTTDSGWDTTDTDSGY